MMAWNSPRRPESVPKWRTSRMRAVAFPVCRRVRARSLQRRGELVSSGGTITHFCKQALADSPAGEGGARGARAFLPQRTTKREKRIGREPSESFGSFGVSRQANRQTTDPARG